MKLIINGYKPKTVHHRWQIIAFLARKDIVDDDYLECDVDEIRDIMKSGAECCYGQLCPYHSEIRESRRLIVSDSEDKLRELVGEASEEI